MFCLSVTCAMRTMSVLFRAAITYQVHAQGTNECQLETCRRVAPPMFNLARQCVELRVRTTIHFPRPYEYACAHSCGTRPACS
jgi:hypothetical protein